MIRGTVSARLEAVIPLRVRGPGGAELSFDAVVDTGFTSSLTLPATAVTALGLIRQSSSAATLGDGSVLRRVRRGGRVGRQLAAGAGVGRRR
jgi:predicted aspartyl protease